MMSHTLRSCCLAFVLVGCTLALNSFTSEKGDLDITWDFVNGDEVEMEVTIDGSSWIAIGFGGGMSSADVVLGWVDDNGLQIGDYWSDGHHAPSLDADLGGRDDVIPVSGTRDGNSTTIRFRRKIDTGDEFDKVLSYEENDMIYAYSTSGQPGKIQYHFDNHNHVKIDLSHRNGVPTDQFGLEEAGIEARRCIANWTVGTLITIQSEEDAGRQGFGKGFPFGSVASFADTVPSTGHPLLLLSTLERNIINWQADPRVSLTAYDMTAEEPMTSMRLTLMGTLVEVPDEKLAAAKKAYLAKHPDSAMWIDFNDFTLYNLVPEDVYWVGGFGNDHYIGYLSAAKYSSAKL